MDVQQKVVGLQTGHICGTLLSDSVNSRGSTPKLKGSADTLLSKCGGSFLIPYTSPMPEKFSVFRDLLNTKQGHVKTMPWVVERIRQGHHKDLITRIRALPEKSDRDELKKGLTSICFSGVFRKREDKSLVEHSGYMVADFDHVEDLPALRDTLLGDPYTCLLFLSPSGDGLKLVVKVPPNAKEHTGRFLALMEYFQREDFDRKNGNLSRVCYESWDPDVYYNPDSQVFTDRIEHQVYDFAHDRPRVVLHSPDRIIANLMKWAERKHPITEGQRNSNVFKLASAMNRCGVAKMTADSFLAQYAQDGFPASEIAAIVNSAYRDTSIHGSSGFNDDQTEDYIRQRGRDGAFFDDISTEVSQAIPDKKERDETIERVINDVDATVFWTKSNKGVVKIDHYKFKKFLQEFGYFKMYPSLGTTYVFVHVEDNLVSNTSEGIIKDFVMDYIEATGDRAVFNYLAGKSSVFKDDYLSMLDNISIDFVKDTENHGTLFYRNCAVRVHKSGKVEEIDYTDLGGYVWKDHILDRDFERSKNDDGEFCRFVELISGNDIERIKAHRTTMGYLMHGWKNLSDNRAVIYNDGVINSNPNGGSGKGIICQGIGKMRRMNVLDGKSFSFDKGFPYQTVSADCQVLVFDDVAKKFNFERLFSVITEGIVLEKKNKDAIKIEVQQSPKIVITTNYTIEGKGGSHDRRKWEVEMSGHFNATHTPLKEFGHQLFDAWDDVQWVMFDNFMVNSLMMYLQGGLYQCGWESMHIRKFINETSPEFWEWVDENDAGKGKYDLGQAIYRVDEMAKFIEEYSDWGPKKYNLTSRRWAIWLEAYGTFKGWEVMSEKNQQGHYTKYVEPGTDKKAAKETIKEEEPW